ncbi:MAG: Fic family protein [Candidatus Aenigmarchaeota archaeon]|nr:Fic family protein [Candidatus Aenigmarchaeota archaeon]
MNIEVQEKNGRKYYYLAGNIRYGKGKWKKVRIYLGKGVIKKKQLEELANEKGKEFIKKLSEARKNTDPLIALISESHVNELDKIKKKFKKEKSKLLYPQYKNYYEHFVSLFTYNTNAIEGSTVTLRETAMILFDKIVPEGKSIKEINEVQNHKDAFDFMLNYKGDLNKPFILKAHKILTHNILWKHAGVFRDVQVYVRGAEFMPATPGNIESEFKKMMLWYRRNKKKYHAVVVAAHMHHVFESIHPFLDGNGRTGRLVLNFILRKNGFPMIDIKYADRSKYYAALGEGNKGNLKPLADLIIKYITEYEVPI